MRTRLLAATLTAFAAVSLAACSSSDSGSGSSAAGSPTTTAAASADGATASAAPTGDATGTAPASTPADGASPGAPAPAKPAPPTDAGLPGKPDADLTAKLVAALDAIDPAIVDGKPGQAVERARSQCQAIFQFPKDKQKLTDLADQRFTSPQHPQGLGPETAAKINDALRSTLCPPPR
ncbi:hypothetical protein ACIBCA_08585 [Kitasatospora sp. NPDC051170]|uniref:hypothetical protein n=1 Tax=Kitasatospora sp. NPDC051170 TaxID=3364056 RepID=UPI0037944AED